MEPEIEYQGLMARAWDPLRGDTSAWEDRSFFLERIREIGEPVLDVGCGTGRLLLDFLQLGLDIDGVEISPDMVAILREKARRSHLDVRDRVRVEAMESMSSRRRYRVVMVPSSSFQLLVDPLGARAAMARFFDHLEPGGVLIMPWIDIAVDYGGQGEDRFERSATLGDGSVLRRRFHGRFDAEAGLEHTVDSYALIRDGVEVETQQVIRSPATRHYKRAEIADLHAKAGFTDLRWCSGFTMDAPSPTDRVVTTLARRPEPPAPDPGHHSAASR